MSDKLVNDVCGVTVSVNGAVEVLVSVTEVSVDVEPVIAVKILSTPPSQPQSVTKGHSLYRASCRQPH